MDEQKLMQRPDILMYAKLAQHKVGYVAGQMELTSKCFQQCVACDSWRADHKGEISGSFTFGQVAEILNQLNYIKTFEHLSFTGGDPQTWMDKDFGFEDLISYATEFVKFGIQANTALVRDYRQPNLWLKLKRIRVSLDGVTRETYTKMRGDDRDPEEVIRRMDALAHPGMSTNTCVTDINIEEIPAIVDRLNRMKHPPRKAMFLAAMDFRLRTGFWERYRALSKIKSEKVPLSFSEDVSGVREFLLTKEAAEIPCYAGAITFHIKCNGEIYPCCLVGGEAIKTRREMAIGNVLTEPIASIHARYFPGLHYADAASPCRLVCQWKQLQVNKIVHEAKKTFLTMP